jgi:hypothetical protein
MAEARPSDRRMFLAAALLVLGRIGLLTSIIYIAARIVTTQTLPNRVWFIGAFSLALTFMASRLFRTPSLNWQVALQASAGAGLALGISILFRVFGTDAESLPGYSGAVGLLLLLIGVASVLALRRLQAKIKGSPSAV